MVAKSSKPSSNLPAQYSERMAQELATISKRIAAPSGDRIRYMSDRGFRTPDGNEGEELEVVVLDFVTANLFYEGEYDRDNPAPPSCFAIGSEPASMAPSNSSPNKQAETCTVCPNNQFGSSGKGKACKNTRLVAVTPLEVPEGEDNPIWIMSIPPTSLREFDAYVSGLASKHKTLPVGVLTSVTMEAKGFASPRFKVLRPLTNDELNVFYPLRDSAMVRLVAEPDVTERAVAAPASKGKAAPAARGKPTTARR